MPRKSREVERSLLAKGFQLREGRHRRFIFYARDAGATGIRTLLSHGRDRDISDHMLAMMARQCRLSRREFERFVDCPLSQDQYEALLRERGHI